MSIRKFLASILSKLTGEPVEENNTLIEEQTENPEAEFDHFLEEEKALKDLEERINVAKRTLMTRLYTLEQDIAVFAGDFPSEYQCFLQRIEELKASYNYSLEELQKLLTFEIDPEKDSAIMDKVIQLEKDIKKFIESTVKFHIITNRLQRLITKLNILYNVSIFHAKEVEKQKVRIQLERAIQLEKELAEEFKKSDYILSDKQQKERIIELLSYVDYEIFKCHIRTTRQRPEELIQKLVLIEDFDEFDYVTTFVAYLKDELSDLLELLPLISDEEQCKLLKNKSEKLLVNLTYSNDATQTLLQVQFWNDYLSFESTLLELLKVAKVPEERITVKVIDRMNIKADEKDVLVSPKSNAQFAFVSIYAETHDVRALLMIKLLEKLSNDITYREIYFLLLLFDVLDVIRNTRNDLSKHIEKYITKYPCNQSDMLEKKQLVLASSQKDYVVLFPSDDAEELTNTLRNLKIDFKVESGNIFINSFYFNGLEHVLSNLQTRTNNMRIAVI